MPGIVSCQDAAAKIGKRYTEGQKQDALMKKPFSFYQGFNFTLHILPLQKLFPSSLLIYFSQGYSVFVGVYINHFQLKLNDAMIFFITCTVLVILQSTMSAALKLHQK